MTHQPQAERTTPDDSEVARQSIVVAQAALYLAQVELTCGRVGCLPAHCRVRDSLRRSLDSERAELGRLQLGRHGMLPRVGKLLGGDLTTAYQVAS